MKRAVFAALIVFVAAFVAVLTCRANAVSLFMPPQDLPGPPSDYGVPQMKAIEVTTKDGLTLQAWFAPPQDKDGKIVIYFHGNGDGLANSSAGAPLFLNAGYGVLLCEYRGYSGNPGTPSEEGVYADARANLSWLEEHGYQKSRFVLYGHSLGTGVAVQMALEWPPYAIILQSPFTSLGDVEKSWDPPVDMIPKDGFHSISKIVKIAAPLLILHGTNDTIVPLRLGQKLFDAANEPKDFYAIPGAGHNDLYSFDAGKLIVDWLDKQVKARNKP